ncbi:energy-coupling factor ABC transporter ATP-binding protein [Romboutsia sp.]|uniref:energy-coupling factor ABC transporter ATP-binding protein n=1 Tax=Romboutsia sp. TaxID=1965302 RepID=UPI003F375390
MFKINNLTYQYEKNAIALNNINMDFSKGDVIGIIGSNGSGKSTLFMNLMGILQPSKGEIYFKDKEIKYTKKGLLNLRKNVGIVFQDPEKQIFYSKVYDDIAFALRNLGIDEATIKIRIEKALKAVNGIDFINKPVHFLSYGQKKRVAIASVIAMENEIVLLDEPTAGLDPVSTRLIVDIIKGLKNHNIKIVISSHDMNLIYEICDYVYVLNKGNLTACGSTEEVFVNEEELNSAGLELPWLVKLHKNIEIPLFKEEQDLYKYWKNEVLVTNKP